VPHIALDTFPDNYTGAYAANDVAAATKNALACVCFETRPMLSPFR